MAKYIKTNTKMKYGASYNKKTDSVDFKLASYNASDVILCIFKNPIGDIPFLEVEMEKDGNIFVASIDKNKLFKKQDVIYYGYRVFGENFKKVLGYKEGSDIGFISRLDNNGNRFNPNKLAYDPYSIELSHTQTSVSSDMTAFRSGDKNYLSDNSKIAPKSVFKIPKEAKIKKVKKRAFKDEIIAEVHLKDLTRLLNIKEKGTYLGAKKFVKEIKKTGVTMVEFLPLSEFDSYFQGGNHWGYMPLNYFAVKKSYSYSKEPYSSLYEFRELINEFHKNDIKVCLDVVYNHTGEGGTYSNNDDARLFSYALIDNKSYYKLAQNGHYTNHSGCSNDLNTLHPLSIDLIVESLSFLINQGVDAFRFDLAVALMDSSTSGYAIYDKKNGMIAKLKEKLEELGHKINFSDDSKDGITLIAEPWMCSGAYNYQLGNFPEYFMEWNDITRDTIRAISIRPNNVNPYAMKNVIEGCPNKFNNEMRSINYVTCHDGFSLFDLNTFDKPNPKTSGGFSGEMCSSYAGDLIEQDNAIRKQILILMLSYGVPMVQFGDIYLQTKQGNNNSYNQDNEINRIDYKLDKRKKNLNNYILNLIKFRKNNEIFSKKDYPKKITYLYPSGAKINEFDESYWKNNSSNILCFKIDDDKDRYYVAISKDKFPIKLHLPKNKKDKNWNLLIDTKKDLINLKGLKHDMDAYTLEPYSACVFKEKRINKLWN